MANANMTVVRLLISAAHAQRRNTVNQQPILRLRLYFRALYDPSRDKK